MMNLLCGDTLSTFMLWVQLSKLLGVWLLRLPVGMLFFSTCQPAHDLKKVAENMKWGDQVHKDDGFGVDLKITFLL